jgi:hypothetical protein
MAKRKLYDAFIEIRDTRNKQHYIVDDEYLNGYARLCGVYATAVYNSMCRHVDVHQQSFPSIDLIAEQHAISRPMVIKATKILESWGIVMVIRSKNEKTKRQNPNIYVLTDKSVWTAKPSHQRLPGRKKAGSISEDEPSKPHNESRVNTDDHKDSHINGAHGKDSETIVSLVEPTPELPNIEKQISEIIHQFCQINPSCKKMFGHKVQRESAQHLIETYSFDRTCALISRLPEINQIPYAPSITTPHELWLKWSKLESALQKAAALQTQSRKKSFVI